MNYPFAIKIIFGKTELGFVPREFAKTISTEIDLNETDYKIDIIKIITRKIYSEVEIEMKEK